MDTPKICCNHPKSWTLRVMHPKDAEGIANSVDPDQTAPLGASWSGSALFAQTYLSENLGPFRYSMVKPHYTNLRIITSIFTSVQFCLFLFTEALLTNASSDPPQLCQVMQKRVLCYMRTIKAQISLRIRAVWSAPLLFAPWIVSRSEISRF